MSAVMKIQRQVQPPQPSMGYGGRGRSYGQMDRYGMGMGPMGMGAPCDAMGFAGRGGGRMGNMGRGEREFLSFSLTPSSPAVPNCCCSKASAPYWSNPPFLISDIRALSPERMSKIKNGELDQYDEV